MFVYSNVLRCLQARLKQNDNLLNRQFRPLHRQLVMKNSLQPLNTLFFHIAPDVGRVIAARKLDIADRLYKQLHFPRRSRGSALRAGVCATQGAALVIEPGEE